MKGIIIILGAFNDDKGNLLSIAIERLNKGINEHKTHPSYKFLLTGGYGEHFNKTNKPYAFYAKQYLIKKGIKEENILEFAESTNTIEDALLSKPIVEKYKIKNLIIVTSDFHLERTKYIFKEVFKDYNLSFSASKTNLSQEELADWKKHENKNLELLKNNKFIKNQL